MSESKHMLGAFELTRPLGQGGMAEVWAATHRTFGGDAAVKVMLGHASASDELREAFVAEARSHAGLDHPHIVRLLDYGRVTDSDEPPEGVLPGDAYLVMELADATARDELPRSWAESRRVLDHVLSGLAYSHARGFIHRDLKPENVLRFGRGPATYKLADFGIAHSVNLDETADRDTLSVTVGTPHYMAPEQFRGHWYEFGPATDLYALGCLAYELACGRVPFPQTALLALASAHMSGPLPELTPRFEVPQGLDAWIRRLLQKDPRDRFRFAADAQHALDALGDTDSSALAEAGATSPAPTVVLDGAATLVDAFTDLMFGATLDAMAVELPDDAPGEIAADAAPRVAAPFPATWRKTEAESVTEHRLGLGLFALRETPVVGFEDVRDELWSVVGEVIAQGRSQVVVLRGTDRSPVEALGRWLVRRVGETGAAVTHDVFYTRAGGPREGLVALLEDAFGTWGMRDDEAARRIGTFVQERVRAEVATSCGEITSDMVLGARGVEDRQIRVPSRGERDRAVAEVLEVAAAGRPSLAWIADAQWGHEAFGFARRVLEREAPAMIVLGVRTDQLDAHAQNRLAELLELDGVVVVDVREPTSDEELMLARAMLPLDPDTARHVVDVSRGDEVAMRLMLDSLRVHDAFEARPDGYVLAAGVALPNSRAEIFARAVSDCVSQNRDILDGLELAAALGRAPDPAELEALLSETDVDTTRLRSALVEHGLARAIGQRWWFVHDGIVSVLEQSARARGTWESVNRRCARVLLKRVGRSPDQLLRAARHFMAAGDRMEALEPMFAAMRELVSNDLARADQLNREYFALCDALQLGPDDERRLHGSVIEMLLLRANGRLEESSELAASIADVAREHGYDRPLGLSLRHLARLLAASRRLPEAIDLLVEAEASAVRLGDVLERAASASVLGQVYDRMGDYQNAIDALERAARGYQEAGDHEAQARVTSIIASVLSHDGRLPEARSHAEEALSVARRSGGVGAAEASSILGDIARLCGDYAEARERYREARQRFAFAPILNVHIVDLNLAIVSLAEGKPEGAERELRRLRDEFTRLELIDGIAIANSGLAVCAAVRGEVGQVRRDLALARDALGRGPNAEVMEVLQIGLDVYTLLTPCREALEAMLSGE